MRAAILGLAMTCACAAGAANAQSMFRGDAAHSGVYQSDAPRQFHRVKWKFPTGDRIVSSARNEGPELIQPALDL